MFRYCIFIFMLVITPLTRAQMNMNTPMKNMNMGGPVESLNENILRHTGSGTSLEPASVAPPMLMQMRPSGWMLMLHGEATAVEQQQTGPRGHDKLFSVNWVMPMAQRSYGRSEFTVRTMLSLEPATITGRFYPELFQQGETAYGKPIVDGQHPHNFFMELAALYDYKMGSHSVMSLYVAPVGDPSLGPEAFPHRASIGDNPLAPLGHHLEDSTHIADEVITGGLAWRQKQSGLRIEASGFHGREPDENRWHIEIGALDSWSARLSVAPGRDWIAQYSVGHLHSPEAVHATEDVLRQTASIAYHHSTRSTSFNALSVWGRNHTIGSAENANSYLLEAALRLKEKHILWTRIEDADRSTDLLGALAPSVESVVGRVQAYTEGYAYRMWRGRDGSAELGAQFTEYGVPDSLTMLYGQHPVGMAVLFIVRLGTGER